MMIAIALITGTVSPAEAQRIYSIGSLNTGDSFINAFEGFRERMTQLGFRERQNVRYQYFNSRGNKELLRTMAHNLVHDSRSNSYLLNYCKAAARATQGAPIPVVFLSAGNSQKLLKSFSGSGNNLTGLARRFGIDRQEFRAPQGVSPQN